MNTNFKPRDYNSLSSYLIVDDPDRLVALLKAAFGAVELRTFRRDDGSIAHTELTIDDSVIMLSGSWHRRHHARRRVRKLSLL